MAIAPPREYIDRAARRTVFDVLHQQNQRSLGVGLDQFQLRNVWLYASM